MNESLAMRFLRNQESRRRMVGAILCLSILVALGVFAGLRKDAIAKTYTIQVLDCPYAREGAEPVAHVHNADCFDEEGNLVCALPELEAHVHDESCYSEVSVLICDLEENQEGENPHTHTDDCYVSEYVLVCDREELPVHVHDAGCFRIEEITADEEPEAEIEEQAEDISENPGTDTVTDPVPPEMPVSDQATDLETAEEDKEDNDGLDAPESLSVLPDTPMPAQSFEQFAGGIRVNVEAPEGAFPEGPTMSVNPVNGSSLKDTVSDAVTGEILEVQAVDISFTDRDGNEIEPATAIRVSITPADSQYSGEQARVVHISDDGEATAVEKEESTEGETSEVVFDADAFSIYAIVYTKDLFFRSYTGETFRISLDYDADARIPEDAELIVREILEEDGDYGEYLSGAENALEEKEQIRYARFFDISIVADGEEVQPAVPVSVRIELAELPQEARNAEAQVIHFGEAPELLNMEAGEADLRFEATSFSVYAVVYTVDFHYEVNGKMYEFSIPGGGYMTLRQLIEVLGIDFSDEQVDTEQFVADVQSVEFSDPALVWVGKAEEESTVGQIKSDNSLECEYSAELTEEQIAEINSAAVSAGEWILISLRPFDTEETLTVTMKNGDVWTVIVTDAQDAGSTDKFDGKTQFVIWTELEGTCYALKADGTTAVIDRNEIDTLGQEYLWTVTYGWNQGNGDDRYYVRPVADPQSSLTLVNGNPSPVQNGSCGIRFYPNSANDTWYLEGWGWARLNLGYYSQKYESNWDNWYSWVHLTKQEKHYTINVTVDSPEHGTVSGTDAEGKSTGAVSDFTIVTAVINENGMGNYDAAAHPITAAEKTGYSFSHWELNGAWLSAEKTLKEELHFSTDNAVLKAVYHADTVISDDLTQEEIEARLNAWVSDMISDTVTASKTAQVSDYNNRIYEITMGASSGVRRVLPTLDLAFITDVSRSMYFPATLHEEGTFTQGTAKESNPGWHQTATGEWVNSDSSLYDWLYRYADKIKIYYVVGADSSATVTAIYYGGKAVNPADSTTDNQWRYVDASYLNAPDGAKEAGTLVKSTGSNDRYGRDLTGTIYTAVGTLRRMDYLQMAAQAASNVLYGVDPSARVGLVTFAKTAYSENTAFYPNPGSGSNAFYKALTEVTLQGGTNQEDGLKEGQKLFENNARKDGMVPKRVAILITDGAPNQTDVTWTTIGTAATNLKNLYGKDSIDLYTLGLSMDMVGEDNRSGLKSIATGGASGGHWFEASNGPGIVAALESIIETIINEASLKGNITDTIDPVFYPVAKDGTPLAAGDMINLDGEKISSIPSDGKYGVITKSGETFGVSWSNQVVGYSGNGSSTWEGKFYVKAKEDFLGGNSINTNVGTDDKFVPTKYVIDGKDYNLYSGDADKLTRSFATPYVNVDELSMTRNSTEWTVYLGTEVDPKEQLAVLLDNIMIREVVSSSTNYMITDRKDMLGGSSTDASETFPLKQVLGDLSDEDWTTLLSQGYLKVDYAAYRHEAGTLTLSISKTGSSAEYDAHKTTETGDKVEEYILSVVYTPAAEQEVDYHTTPGGSPGAPTGNIRSDNIHVINVFAKRIEIKKVDQLKTAITGDSAEFVLYRKATAAELADDSVTKTSPAGLPEGNYVLVQTLTTKDGSVISDVLSLTETNEPYYLIETKAPAGYNMLAEALKVTIDMDGHNTWTKLSDNSESQEKPDPYVLSNWLQAVTVKLLNLDDTSYDRSRTSTYSSDNDTTETFPISNNSGYELPSTGGEGTLLLSVIGTICMLSATLGILAERKKREAYAPKH